MVATNTTRQAKDGGGVAFPVGFAAESVSANSVPSFYVKEPGTETLISPATAAKQPALGTATTPSADFISVHSTTCGSLSTPASILTRPANTTAYSLGDIIASSITAGSIVVPSFNIGTSGGRATIPRLRLSTNVTIGWDGVVLEITLWRAAPTFANGDNGAYSVATGSANTIAKYQTVLEQAADGAWGDAVSAGAAPIANPSSAAAIYWSLKIVTGTPTPISGQTFTLTPEIWN